MSMPPSDIKDRYVGYKLRAILAEDAIRKALAILRPKDGWTWNFVTDREKKAIRILEKAVNDEN